MPINNSSKKVNTANVSMYINANFYLLFKDQNQFIIFRIVKIFRGRANRIIE